MSRHLLHRVLPDQDPPQGDPLHQHPLHQHPLVTEARAAAGRFLGDSTARWHHSAAVAGRACDVVAAVRGVDRPALVAAAWLHDIGYAEQLRGTGFHPLDGARYLRDQGWPPLVTGLVAHHSGARFVAAVQGLSADLHPFDDPRHTGGPLADALTCADQTIGPEGRPMDVEDRLADMLRRHGPDSANARCHAQRAPMIRAAVRRTESRLRRSTITG